LIFVVCLVFLASSPVCSGPATAAKPRDYPATVEEYQLKAVYLFNFLHFVRWPERRCGAAGTQLREIAVVGENPFGDVLASLQEKLNETQQQPLSLVFFGPYRKGMKLGDCCILFISSSERDRIPQIINGLGDAPVLTVSDAEGFIEAGGMVELISRGNKIRWAINRGPVQRAGLRLSAKLLDIALQVVER